MRHRSNEKTKTTTQVIPGSLAFGRRYKLGSMCSTYVFSKNKSLICLILCLRTFQTSYLKYVESFVAMLEMSNLSVLTLLCSVALNYELLLPCSCLNYFPLAILISISSLYSIAEFSSMIVFYSQTTPILERKLINFTF